MNRWKIAFFALLAVGAYVFVQISLVLGDRNAELKIENNSRGPRDKALATLCDMMPAISALQHPATRDDVTHILLKQNPGIPITSGSSSLEIDGLGFLFDASGALYRIEQVNNYGTPRPNTP